MANNKNHIKKRYYPLRDAENPYKVSLVEITEVQYRALYPEIWSTQKCEQYHHRCMCSKKYIWKCDGKQDINTDAPAYYIAQYPLNSFY